MRHLRWVFAVTLFWACPAWAGPPELFRNVVDSRDADSLVLYYEYGQGGFYFSRDAGQTFEVLCSSAIDPMLADGQIWAMRERPDGRMLLGLFSRMLISDPDKCSWSEVPEFAGRWVSDLVRDPEAAAATYAVTSSGAGDNGLYRNDGASDAWTRIGDATPDFLTRLHVVKHGSGVRMYIGGAQPAKTSTERPHYYVRVSDDRGQSWQQHDFGDTDGTMRLVAVDPTDADRIVATVQRAEAQKPDDILVSAQRGEPGTFQKIGSVTTLVGVAFASDGTLFYGDNDQGSPGLFKLDKGASEPRQISNEYKVSCLSYDDAHQRLYVCRDWLFGTADPSSGAFTTLADMRTARHFVACPDEATIAARCESQFRLNYCGPGHYDGAPICYYYPGASGAGSGGAAGASGSAGAAGMSVPQAGASAPRAGQSAGAAGSGRRVSGGGCSFGGQPTAQLHGALWLAVCFGYLSLRRRRCQLQPAQLATHAARGCAEPRARA